MGQNVKKASFYTNKIIFSLILAQKWGIMSPRHPLCRRVCMDSKKTKIFKISNIGDIQNA